jgi:hypothetical protein
MPHGQICRALNVVASGSIWFVRNARGTDRFTDLECVAGSCLCISCFRGGVTAAAFAITGCGLARGESDEPIGARLFQLIVKHGARVALLGLVRFLLSSSYSGSRHADA